MNTVGGSLSGVHLVKKYLKSLKGWTFTQVLVFSLVIILCYFIFLLHHSSGRSTKLFRHHT